jgi:hypothetical protein
LEKSIVRGEIRKNRYTLDLLSKTALKLHLKLAHDLDPDVWRKVDALAALKADNANRMARSRQESKLKKLLSQKENASNGMDAKKVVNISSHELNHSELSVLNKGLNFAISPSSIPFDNLICCIEDSIKTLADEDKDQVRQDCVVILRNSKPPKSNISKEERIAINNL